MMCDRTIVMQTGRVVEEGPSARLFAAPETAYTRELVPRSRIYAGCRRAHDAESAGLGLAPSNGARMHGAFKAGSDHASLRPEGEA